MEKLTAAVLEYPRIAHHSEDLLKKVFPRRKAGVGPGCDRKRLFLTRDRLFSALESTADGSTKSTAATAQNAELLDRKSRAILDLGSLGYQVERKEEELRSWAHYKIGLTKLLHNYDNLYSKFYRDLMKDVMSMNKASNLVYSSPKNLMDSMRTVMSAMKGFVGMLQPMAQVMGRMNEINLNIVKLGHEVGPEGANKIFRTLYETIQSYPDVAGGVGQIGRSSENPSDELMVGKFYTDWTAECLAQGVEALQYAGSLVQKHTRKLRTLALLSKTANTVKQQKKDPKSFTLPRTFATEEVDKEAREKRELDDIEQGMSQFTDVNRLEMEIPDITDNELLQDPYLLASESIAQASLTRDITGLDETSRLATQTHGALF